MIDARARLSHTVLAASAVSAILAGLFVRADAAWAQTSSDAASRANQSSVDLRLKADEQEMLATARREADERRRASRILDGSVGVPASELPIRQTVNIGEPAAAEKVQLEKKRQDELQRLSDKLRRASAMRPVKAMPPIDTPWTTEVTASPQEASPIGAKPDYQPESRSALGQPPSTTDIAKASNAGSTGRVAVLMIMTPGDRGIRRFDKTADPILCSNDGCYISNGSGTPAQFVSLHRTFGFANTFGPRAGACRQQTGCVFRGVDISADNAILQPVDLKVLVHDRRAIKAAIADSSCHVDAGRLTCARPIRGENYTLWVVPEHVANKAGIAALQKAIADGLPEAINKASLN